MKCKSLFLRFLLAELSLPTQGDGEKCKQIVRNEWKAKVQQQKAAQMKTTYTVHTKLKKTDLVIKSFVTSFALFGASCKSTSRNWMCATQMVYIQAHNKYGHAKIDTKQTTAKQIVCVSVFFVLGSDFCIRICI